MVAGASVGDATMIGVSVAGCVAGSTTAWVGNTGVPLGAIPIATGVADGSMAEVT